MSLARAISASLPDIISIVGPVKPVPALLPPDELDPELPELEPLDDCDPVDIVPAALAELLAAAAPALGADAINPSLGPGIT